MMNGKKIRKLLNKWYLKLAAISATITLIFGWFGDRLENVNTYFEVKDKFIVEQNKATLNNEFDKTDEKKDIIILPFTTSSTTSSDRIAPHIYERMDGFRELLNLPLDLRLYNIVKASDINKTVAENIKKRTKADVVIWGQYERRGMNNSIVNKMQHVLNESTFTNEENIKFEGYLNDAFQTDIITRNMELRVLMMFSNFDLMDEFSELDWILFESLLKEKLKNTQFKYSDDFWSLEDLMAINSTHKSWELPYDIYENETYGLSPKTPMYSKYPQLTEHYLNQLTYQGMQVTIEGKNELAIDFDVEITETGSLTWVNAYAMVNKDGIFIDSIYVFEKSMIERLRPPKGFKTSFSELQTNGEKEIELKY